MKIGEVVKIYKDWEIIIGYIAHKKGGSKPVTGIDIPDLIADIDEADR